MAFQQTLLRGHGHPWTRESGWDVLEVCADSRAELEAYVAAAGRKFWKVWAKKPGAHAVSLYKPRGASSAWLDSPGTTRVGQLMSEAAMDGPAFALDALFATLTYQLQKAPTGADFIARIRVIARSYGPTQDGGVDATALLAELQSHAASDESGQPWKESVDDFLFEAKSYLPQPTSRTPAATPQQSTPTASRRARL